MFIINKTELITLIIWNNIINTLVHKNSSQKSHLSLTFIHDNDLIYTLLSTLVRHIHDL